MTLNLDILIDMDDTIENLSEVWISRINELHGTNVSPNDITEWDYRVAFPDLRDDDIYMPLSEESLWERVTPLPGAVKYISELMNDGHNVYIVTASSYLSVEYKVRHVLLKYFPFIPLENVIISSKKQMIDGDVLVDDGPHNLIGRDRLANILMTANHNRKFVTNDKNKIIRANSWSEIYKIISDIANMKGVI